MNWLMEAELLPAAQKSLFGYFEKVVVSIRIARMNSTSSDLPVDTKICMECN